MRSIKDLFQNYIIVFSNRFAKDKYKLTCKYKSFVFYFFVF